VTGANVWEGTVQFSLKGPGANATPVNIGDPVDVSNLDNTVTSANATVTSAGDYCWSAAFTSETSGVPDGVDNGENECFTVNPVTPTLATTAGADVTLGQPITDTANLSGTANQPGDPVINPTTPGDPANGTITFKLFGPSTTGCGPEVAAAEQTVNVSGNSSATNTYTASYTPEAPGNYHWVATYSGDSPNTTGPVTHNADCTDTNEDVTVLSVASSMTTAQSFIPNDEATITAPAGSGNLAGSVTFELFESSDCSGTAIYTTDPAVPVSGASPQTVETDNTTVSTTAADVSWRVSYDSTNPAQRDIPASCHESSTLTITNGGTISSPAL
jgi:hypothetical protein